MKKAPAPGGWFVIPTFQVQGFGGLLVLVLLRVIFAFHVLLGIEVFLFPQHHVMIWYHKWYQFFIRRDTTFGAPLRNSPERLRCSLLFHREDQAAPVAQISLPLVAQW